MAALQCEICGGKLIGRAGGLFECDSCGMEFDTAWVKEKIQEIKGTVKVEGTVEVQGTVKVDGPIEVKGGVNVENLIKRGNLALEDGKWADANAFFDEALNYEPECADVYIGKLLVDMCIKKREDLVRCSKRFDNNKNYRKALRFADDNTKKILAEYEKSVTEREIYSKARNILKEARTNWMSKEKNYEKAIRLFDSIKDYKDAAVLAEKGRKELQRTSANDIYEKARSKMASASCEEESRDAAELFGTIIGYKDAEALEKECLKNAKIMKQMAEESVASIQVANSTLGLRSDGTVTGIDLINDKNSVTTSILKEISNWKGVISLAAGKIHVIGLRSDGTVVAAGGADEGECDVASWCNIVTIAAGLWHTVGLCDNGTVVAVGDNYHGQCAVSDWRNIVAIAAGPYHTVGLRADGTVVAAGEKAGGQCEVNDWEGIVSIDIGCLPEKVDAYYTAGLCSDGTVVIAGNKPKGDAVKQELLKKKSNDLRCKRAALQGEQTKLQAELPTLKGLFSGGRRKEVEARLAQIPTRISEIDSELAHVEKELAELE